MPYIPDRAVEVSPFDNLQKNAVLFEAKAFHERWGPAGLRRAPPRLMRDPTARSTPASALPS
jgi:hypothetical protein